MLKDKLKKKLIFKKEKKLTRVNMLNSCLRHETEITLYKKNKIKQWRSTLRQTK